MDRIKKTKAALAEINMPYSKVFIHYIWSTKNRQHLINEELKPLLINHIKENSIKKEIEPGTIANSFEKFPRRVLDPWPGYKKVYYYWNKENNS